MQPGAGRARAVRLHGVAQPLHDNWDRPQANATAPANTGAICADRSRCLDPADALGQPLEWLDAWAPQLNDGLGGSRTFGVRSRPKVNRRRLHVSA